MYGWEGSVFTLTSKACVSPMIFDGIEVFQVKRDIEIASTPFSVRAPFALRKILPTFDLLHFHYPFPFGDLMYLIANLKLPSIATYHSDIVRQKNLHQIYKPLEKWFFSAMDRVVCTSPNYLETSENLNILRSKVDIVPLGIDEALIPQEAQNRQSFEDCPKEPFILFIGVLRTYKGINILLEAAKFVRGTIVVAGGGELLWPLRVRLKKEKIDNVVLLGEVSDFKKFGLLSKCRALVLPSNQRTEAFGIVLVEASMLGKPMISTEIGTGTSFVNLDESTGVVVKSNCEVALADAMNRMLENEHEASLFGMASRTRYEAHFTGQKMCEGYSRIYEKVV